MEVRKFWILAAGTLFLAACGGTPERPAEDRVPDWVADPGSQVQGGLAATECVPAGEEFSIDRNEAAAGARAQLAQMVETGVQAMDTTYQRQVRGGDQEATGSNFEAVSRQLTDQSLRGVSPQRVDYATFNQQRHLCVMMSVGDEQTRNLAMQIIADAEADLSAEDTELLYEEFRSKSARQEMDEALEARRDD